jgi:hypothetical protein
MYMCVYMYVCMYVCIMSRGSLTFLFLNTRLDYLEDLKVKKKKKVAFGQWSFLSFQVIFLFIILLRVLWFFK